MLRLDGEDDIDLSGGDPDTTNNRMEMTAVVRGLDQTPAGSEVLITSDSSYVINTMTKGWKRKVNQDLWAELDRTVGERHVTWQWVKGHNGHTENERADRLAVGAAEAIRDGLTPPIQASMVIPEAESSEEVPEAYADHTRAAEAALARAKRLVEAGEDVVILVDSLTRLARAYNLSVPGSGKTLSGGMDPVALYPPKGFFGAARNCDEAGSLTILATCLIDTGSRLDDLIYEEFKGTGNMELHLSRVLAERRVYPAIDIQRSGTRHEELLLSEQDLRQIWLLRRMVSIIASDSGGDNTAGTERVIERMSKTQDNEEFLASINKVG